jgi:hypothetical protein
VTHRVGDLAAAGECGDSLVSPVTTVTSAIGTPSSSAAICAIAVVDPVRFIVPVMTWNVPSGLARQ